MSFLDKNDDSDYDYLTNEYKQVINILKTFSDANFKNIQIVSNFLFIT